MRRIGFFVTYAIFVLVLLELALRLGGFLLLQTRRQMHDHVRSTGEFRILAIGESTTFGLGVPQKLAYPQRLAAMLNEDGDRRYVVVNTGVPGQTSTSILRNVPYQLDKYRPQLVIAQFGVNDFNDALNDLSSRVIFDFYVPEPIVALRIFRLFMVARDFAFVRWKAGRDGAWTFFDLDQRQPDGSWRQRPEYAKQLELNYDDIVDTIRASGARLIMVSYMRASRQVCKMLRSIARRKGVPLVEFESEMRTSAAAPTASFCDEPDNALFTADRFHPNEEGHRRMAVAIHEVVGEQGF